MQSGAPFTVTMQTNNTNSFSAGANRANVLRDGNLPSSERTVERWFDTTVFADPGPYKFGNAGCGILRADGRVNFDFSVAKNFNFAEKRHLQFRTELFNAFNHPARRRDMRWADRHSARSPRPRRGDPSNWASELSFRR
jgi:hypothetical protein